ncbi:MAG: hypothetical protein ACLQPH_07690 [Acidimicrobiales bacterium]
MEELEHTLSEALGPHFRVNTSGPSKVKVGRTGVIPSVVEIAHRNGMTVFKIRTTGLIISRVVQVASINPHVRRALEEAYSQAA